jgi:N-acetylmuramoyl-L-alanine amidase
MSKKFYVGAGHSNYEPGAVAGNLREADLMTELRNLVAERLKATGAEVVTDGEGSTNLPLSTAINLARTCPSGAIELHLNAGSAVARGVECLSLPDQKPRAQSLARAIGAALQIPLRGDQGWKSDSEGQHSRLGFCREGHGIVVECFFLSNPDELHKYQADKAALAKAIAEALLAMA